MAELSTVGRRPSLTCIIRRRRGLTAG